LPDCPSCWPHEPAGKGQFWPATATNAPCPAPFRQRLKNAVPAGRLFQRPVKAEAEVLAAEGWKWIEVATDLPYGYRHGLRRLAGDPAPMTNEENAAHAALLAEYRGLEEEYSGQDECPE